MKNSFTLIEVLVAVVILAGVIGAAAAIETRNVSTSSQNKRQLEALGLAQQGLNLTKSIKDTDSLKESQDSSYTPIFPSPTEETPYKLDLSATPALSPNGLDTTSPCSAVGTTNPGPGEIITLSVGGGERKYCRVIKITPSEGE